MTKQMYVSKPVNDSGLLFGVFNTTTGQFEDNPKTHRNFVFTSLERAEKMAKMYNDAYAEAHKTELEKKRAVRAKAGSLAKPRVGRTHNRAAA